MVKGIREVIWPDTHKAVLSNLHQTENWHMDARKCMQGLEMGTGEKEGHEEAENIA